MIRVIGAIVALVLTIGGAIALAAYVGSAETRAQNGAKSQQVYVVAAEIIPRGTRAEDVRTKVKVAQIPAIAVQSGLVTDLQSIAGKVTTTDLLPGEQLVAARFAAPDALGQAASVPVPKGLSEVTITLPVERAIGGEFKPGDFLGLIATTNLPGDWDDPYIAKSALHKLLVTRVALGTTYQQPSAESGRGTDGESADDPNTKKAVPVSSLMITVAVTTPQAEQIVYMAELATRFPIVPQGVTFAPPPLVTLWGIRETKDSATDGSVLRTKDNVFQ